MESEKNPAGPPPYTPPASNPYLTAEAASTPAPGTTPYPAAGRQQYPTPSVYLPPVKQNPPATGSAPGGQPYGQPPPQAVGYPPQPGYVTPQYHVGAPPPQQPQQPQQQQQQQQQVVVVTGASQQPAVIVQHVPSFVGHIVFSCFVIWCCCNCVCGLIAFILAG